MCQNWQALTAEKQAGRHVKQDEKVLEISVSASKAGVRSAGAQPSAASSQEYLGVLLSAEG